MGQPIGDDGHLRRCWANPLCLDVLRTYTLIQKSLFFLVFPFIFCQLFVNYQLIMRLNWLINTLEL